jgi:hypothetical protein
MAITYTYLDPGSEFTASSLNLRFEAAIGTAGGLNQLSVEDLSVGAFRHNHLPRLLLPAGVSDVTTYEDMSGLGSGSRNIFSTMKHTSFGVTTPITGDTSVVDITYVGLAFPLGMDTTSHVGAVIVLANADLDRIDVETAQGKSGTWLPNEDVHYGTFWIRITDSLNNDYDLPRTYRTLSPRVTISDLGTLAGGYFYPGLFASATVNDKLTNQDVAIRTVITSDDLTLGELTDLKSVSLMAASPTSPLWKSTLQVGKANITAIPLHTKINSL